eukprot:CAMPEP_0185212490 /NCGR_PEP_ID=MMETSP1140-20130426/67557_1 /TAXON_ID=298111 /ORGANISM="Pavlova sp., Strain CCMP459" /LENGTH=121 /DNA_ID=CAMNT_0027780347 /DNA_START=6 /DNA_END=372 /DNA_ORIENTATION=+
MVGWDGSRVTLERKAPAPAGARQEAPKGGGGRSVLAAENAGTTMATLSAPGVMEGLAQGELSIAFRLWWAPMEGNMSTSASSQWEVVTPARALFRSAFTGKALGSLPAFSAHMCVTLKLVA